VYSAGTICVYRYVVYPGVQWYNLCVQIRGYLYICIHIYVNCVHPAGTICACRYSERPGVQFVYVDVRAKFVFFAGTICVYR